MIHPSEQAFKRNGGITSQKGEPRTVMVFRDQGVEYPDQRELLWIRWTVRLPESLFKRLRKKVEESGLSYSDIMRLALRQYLGVDE